jgi:asparagine synthase (glutamine-hydrolysing)
MFGYIAFVWDSTRADCARVAHELSSKVRSSGSDWDCVLDQNGARVFVQDAGAGSDDSHVLTNSVGVILGTVFKRAGDDGTPDAAATFGPAETRKLLESQGRYLTSDYWGRYVAVLCDLERRCTYILRSPSGEVDCLTTEFQGVRVYFSSMSACIQLGLTNHTINWSYVAAFLCTPLYESRQTGLDSVTRVVHGECICVQHSRAASSWCWHPVDFAEHRAQEDVEQAAHALRNTTRTCIHSWAARYSQAIVLLSGGFDSSVVVTTLAGAPARPNLTCMNYRNPHDLSTDERHFARLAASHADARLVEHEQQVVFDLRERLVMPAAESPFSNFYLFAPDYGAAHVTQQTGANVIISGEGGDQLFYQNGAGYACRDYRRRHGIRTALLRLALDAARMEGATVWDVLVSPRFRSATAQLTAGIARYQFVSANVRESVGQCRLFVHPWFDRDSNLPPGKWWHLFCLTTAMDRNMYDPIETAQPPENLAPLVSQPLLELVLQLPTYLLLTGGRDRGLARRAFRPDLPNEIRLRRSKAATYDSAKVLLASNLGFVKEMLMDGMLAREGILDRASLQSVLRGVGKIEGHAGQILICLMCEAWLRQWSNCGQRIAA